MKIKNHRSLSNATFHRRCSGRQGYWWLRGANGFIEIGEHRGDRDIALDVDLPPGEYTLGCGPAGQFGVREKFTV